MLTLLKLVSCVSICNLVECGKVETKLSHQQLLSKKNSNNGISSRSTFENPYTILPYVYSTTESREDWAPFQAFLPVPEEYNGYASTNIQSNGNSGHIDQKYKYKNDLKDFGSVEIKIPYNPSFDERAVNHKPIEEPIQEIPRNPVPVDELTKAAVEPVPIFTNSEQQQSSAKEDRNQDNTGKYEYEYIVEDHKWGAHYGHREYHNGDHTKGKYQVLLPDGRLQTVQYWSGPSGYHAVVSYDTAIKHRAIKNEIYA